MPNETPPRIAAEGRYREFRNIGEGGMGIVYLAVDTELNREVALKIARPGKTARGETPSPLDLSPPDDSDGGSAAYRALTARFLQEAWVTGGLEHPGVVPVYELGRTPAGVPYYTMRLIRGELTLGRAIAAAGTLEKRLDLLEPFLKVCDAIAYAHSRGVIHRDLKPENIALGEFGEVVVLDWGLAKAVGEPDPEEDLLTKRVREFREVEDFRTVADVLGTPGYMPPEAIFGDAPDLDERSDVFSLGVILFRILTGRLPFDFWNLEEYAEKLLKEPMPTARSVDPGVPDGLSRICARPLARNPEHRFASAADLARAIRSYRRESVRQREVDAAVTEARVALEVSEGLEGPALVDKLDRVTALCSRLRELEPDNPEPDELAARVAAAREAAVAARERSARTRVLRTAVAVVLLLAAATGVTVAAILDARREEAESARARAETERVRADGEKARAVEERARAEELTHFMLYDLYRGLRDLNRLDLLANVAQKSAEYYESLPAEGIDDATLMRRGVALRRVATVLRWGGDLEASADACREAIPIYRRLCEAAPDDPERALELTLALMDLSKARVRLGDAETALSSAEEARDILARLAREHPGVGNYRKGHAFSLNRVAEALKQGGDAAESRALYEESFRLRRALVVEYPEHEKILVDFSSSLDRMLEIHAGLEALPPLLRTTLEAFRGVRGPSPGLTAVIERIEAELGKTGEPK